MKLTQDEINSTLSQSYVPSRPLVVKDMVCDCCEAPAKRLNHIIALNRHICDRCYHYIHNKNGVVDIEQAWEQAKTLYTSLAPGERAPYGVASRYSMPRRPAPAPVRRGPKPKPKPKVKAKPMKAKPEPNPAITEIYTALMNIAKQIEAVAELIKIRGK
jgi:hypothetical protein